MVDTISLATAFDPSFRFYPDPPQYGGSLLAGDDEFDCTFPPPNYSCPEGSMEINDSGSWFVEIRNEGSCVTGLSAGEYVITVTLDGASVSLTQYADDEPS